jgi:hypothetical protein
MRISLLGFLPATPQASKRYLEMVSEHPTPSQLFPATPCSLRPPEQSFVKAYMNWGQKEKKQSQQNSFRTLPRLDPVVSVMAL